MDFTAWCRTLTFVVELLKEGDLFLEKYRIEKRIGQGGMGAVYAAVNEALAKRVAIKVLLPEVAKSKEAANRFINEARASDRITGEHVARVFDVGQTREGLSYMVLEFLDGEDVSQMLETRGAPTPIAEAVDIVLEALEAIAEAHAMGIVHRDLKPGNLFLARKANGARTVKVLDFGISKATNPFALGNSDHALTSTRSMLGSPLYMSPEQLRSSKNVDRRSDIWALGVILYEMLGGVVPFNGDTLGELFVAILEQPVVPVGHRRPEVPPALADVVHRCLERDPARRVQDAAELAQLLAPFASRSLGSVERVRSFSLGADGAAPPLGALSGSVTDASGSVAVARSAAISGSGVLPSPPSPGQTNASWAGSGAIGAPPPGEKPRVPMRIAAVAGLVVLLLVVAGGGVAYMKSQASTSPSTSATAEPVPPAPEVSAPAPSASATAPASTSVAGAEPSATAAPENPPTAPEASSAAKPVAKAESTAKRTADSSASKHPPPGAGSTKPAGKGMSELPSVLMGR